MINHWTTGGFMKKQANCDQLSSFFAILSNSLRLKILCTLHNFGEQTISELVERTGSSKHNISIQLKYLRLSHIIQQRKDRRFVYSQIKDLRVVNFIKYVAENISINENITEQNFNEVQLWKI